jgi:hypothetical protein
MTVKRVDGISRFPAVNAGRALAEKGSRCDKSLPPGNERRSVEIT